MTLSKSTPTRESGFTLVELAIVMIIIGLLIAGVLKGQELIGNARVTSTVAQIKAIDAGVSTFRDMYSALPGDMTSASTRLPNCTTATACGNSGNGDGQLSTAPGVSPGAEAQAFFPQMAAANLLTGIQPVASGTLTIGGNFPAAKIDATGIQPGYSASATLASAIGTSGTNGGLFLALVPTIGAVTTTSTSLKANEASRIDTKLDDGSPGTGDVVGIGTAGTAATNCGAANAGGQYATIGTGKTCGLYIHIQG